ncbi:hypothetical protein ACR31S_00885 [Streptococcus iniae]
MVIPTDHQSYQDNNRQAFAGKLLAIVQMTGDSGQVLLKATSKGLKGQNKALKSTQTKNQKQVQLIVMTWLKTFTSKREKNPSPAQNGSHSKK